jgi:rhamnosyltransferase
MHSFHGAVVVTLYGPTPPGLWQLLSSYSSSGLLVVAVNNNTTPRSAQALAQGCWLDNANRGGLAGGLNRGIEVALLAGCQTITLLDQDSALSQEAVLTLHRQLRDQPDQVLGPAVWDQDRQTWHTPPGSRPRLLITSGTSFTAATWQQVGHYLEWMEIDYIDHEWCSRARQLGLEMRVLPAAELKLSQQFGQRHPNGLAHRLGLQLYSPYRRAVALRNLRWLAQKAHVPLDIRLKEVVKMAVKPWLWLALEPHQGDTLRALLVGLQAPPGQPFPRARLEGIAS